MKGLDEYLSIVVGWVWIILAWRSGIDVETWWDALVTPQHSSTAKDAIGRNMVALYLREHYCTYNSVENKLLLSRIQTWVRMVA